MKTWHKVLGIALVVIGAAGIFLPILPGWILFFIGLALLGVGSSSTASWIKRKLGVRDIDPEEEIKRLPKIYRTIVLSIDLLVQTILIGLSAALFRDKINVDFIPQFSFSMSLLYLFPFLVFLLGVAGLFVSAGWKPPSVDAENDAWEQYFTYEIIGLPLFWALLLLLVGI